MIDVEGQFDRAMALNKSQNEETARILYRRTSRSNFTLESRYNIILTDCVQS